MFAMNSKRARRVALSALAALSAAAMLTSCASGGNGGDTGGDTGGETSGEPIRIGALYPTSGPLALLGEESWRGVELAVTELNENGGIDGREIKIDRADVPDVNAAGAEARRLLDGEGLDLVVGTYSSGLALAGSEVYARGGGTYIELGAVSMDYNSRGYDGVLRTNANASAMADAQLDFIENWVADALEKSNNDLKILLVHEDSSYGSSLARSFTEKAAEDGITDVSAVPYSSESTDLTSTVLNIGQADADVVIAVSYASDAILLARQMAENGVSVPAFIGSGGGHTLTGFGETLGENADYVFNTDFPQYNINTESTPGLEEFVAMYQAKYNSDPASGHSLANYVGMQAVFEILRETGGEVDRESVMGAAATIDIPEGQSANGWGFKFDDVGQNTRARDYITQWIGGEQPTVWPEEMAVQEPQLAPSN